MVPVLGPEVVSVDAAGDQAGNDGTMRGKLESFWESHVVEQWVAVFERNVQDGELAPEVCGAIESVSSSHVPAHHTQWRVKTLTVGAHTAGRSGVVLDSSALTVELVVDNPRRLSLGTVEAALSGSAGLLRGTLREAGNVAREHGGWVREYAWRWRGEVQGVGR